MAFLIFGNVFYLLLIAFNKFLGTLWRVIFVSYGLQVLWFVSFCLVKAEVLHLNIVKVFIVPFVTVYFQEVWHKI